MRYKYKDKISAEKFYVEGVKMNVKPDNEKVKQFLSLTPVFWESPASFIERYRSAPVIMITAMSPLQKASGTMCSWMFHQSSYPWRTFFLTMYPDALA